MDTLFQELCYGKDKRHPILTQVSIVITDTSKENGTGTVSTINVRLEIEASEQLTDVTAYY